MAEPLSIAASLATLIGCFNALRRSVATLRELRAAPEKLAAFESELTSFEICLDFIAQRLRDSDGTDDAATVPIMAVVHRATQFMEEIQLFLNSKLRRQDTTSRNPLRYLNDRLRRQDKSSRIPQRYPSSGNWVWYKETITDKQKRLRHLRDELVLALAGSSFVYIRATKIESETRDLSIMSSSNAKGQRKVEPRFSSAIANPDQDTPVSGQQHECNITRAISFSECEAKHVRLASEFEVQDSNIIKPCIPGLDFFGRHELIPRHLSRLLGSFSIVVLVYHSIYGKPNSRKNTKSKQLRVAYRFPTWLVGWVMHVYASASNRGPELILRVSRTVPTESQQFIFAYFGYTVDLKTLLDHGEISPTDVDGQSGHTALHVSKSTIVINDALFVSQKLSSGISRDIFTKS